MIKNLLSAHFNFILLWTKPNIKVEEIMKGDTFIGEQPLRSLVLDSKKVYFEWNPKQ
jgi:hypothetical protein